MVYIYNIYMQPKTVAPIVVEKIQGPMRKAVRAKEIIESAMPAPLDNIDDLAPLNEENFDIGLVGNPEDTPEEPELLNEENWQR